MDESISRQALVEMLKDNLKETHAEVIASQPLPKIWVVTVNEELSSPAIQGFSDTEQLGNYLKTVVGKPGYCYVIKGHRCSLSVGSLPVLYTPDEVVPLFDVLPPVINDNGSTTAPATPQVVPETPADVPTEADDEPITSDIITIDAETPSTPITLPEEPVA